MCIKINENKDVCFAIEGYREGNLPSATTKLVFKGEK